MKAGSKTVFGIFLIITILFILWLYDTNRFGVILGALKGRTSVINAATGGELPSTVPPSAVYTGNAYQTPIPAPYQNGQTYQVPKSQVPPALVNPNPSTTINPASFVSTFIQNQLNSIFNPKSVTPAPTINTIPGINGTVLA